MTDHLHYTWEQFDKDCERIARWAKEFGFKNIFGVPRSGIMVAIRVSHLLNIPLVDNADEIDPDDTLIVDDAIETGETMAILEDAVGELIFASILWNENGPEPDFYCHKKVVDVVFPWESGLEGAEDKITGSDKRPEVQYGTIRYAVRTNKKGLA
jgi:hypoxanthine phosphoribosyltransferase